MSTLLSYSTLAAVLARAMLAGDAALDAGKSASEDESIGADRSTDLDAMTARCVRMLGRRWRWLRPLMRRYLEWAAQRGEIYSLGPKRREVAEWLRNDEGFAEAWRKYSHQISIAQWLVEPAGMSPLAAAREWEIPALATEDALAEWLRLTDGELEWFADLKGMTSKHGIDERLRHYRTTVLAKPGGGARLIEAPKQRLKLLQRQILREILEAVPVHEAAHGFCKGRSIQTFAARHVGKLVVLRMDLADFFASISSGRVQGFFRVAGFPERVADFLGGMCTTSTPGDVWIAARKHGDRDVLLGLREVYGRRHLPQGAPTSPALANLCAYRVDCRLSGLAKAAGAEYTRYADDLAFSGDAEFERQVEWFAARAAAIVMEEGFRVQHRKTRVMRQGVRQHLAGLVINERVNVVRADYEQLKATLHNCARYGPEGQNREGHADFRLHLTGRVGFVESIHPRRGKRLRGMLEQIRWEG